MSLSAILGHRVCSRSVGREICSTSPPLELWPPPRLGRDLTIRGVVPSSIRGLLGTESRRVGPQLIHDAGSSERRPPSSPYTL
jgi:hypothetical protein